MNDYQKQLVQNSFRKIVPIADQVAVLFYKRLFILDPSLRPLFKGDMTQQGLKFINTIQAAVNGLDNLEGMISPLQSLGRNHIKYGVQDAHYETVGEALIWALEKGLGEGFTEETRSAWHETYSILSTVMREAAAAEESNAEKAVSEGEKIP